MSTWTVSSLNIESIADSNPGQSNPEDFFGAEESQDSVEGQTIPGNFIMEIWSRDRSECIWILQDNPLPPSHGSGADLRSANSMPNVDLSILSYYYESDPNQRISETWRDLDMPAGGWPGKTVHLTWSQD